MFQQLHAGYAGVGRRLPNSAVAIPRTGGGLSGEHPSLWPGLSGTPAAMKIVSSLHRLLYRVSRGKVGRTLRGGPVLLLTTTGRKTGEARTWPLSYVEAEDEVVLVASAAGAPRHPGWYLNLRANPRVSIQLGDRSRTMIARTAEGRDRTCLWERLVRQYPVLNRYQRNANREFPVIVLQPVTAEDGMSRTAAAF